MSAGDFWFIIGLLIVGPMLLTVLIKMITKPSTTTDESNEGIDQIATHNNLNFDYIKRIKRFGATICLDFNKSTCVILYQGGVPTILKADDVKGSNLKYNEISRGGKLFYEI